MEKHSKSLCKWTPEDVVEFLITINLENYGEVFLQNKIDGIKLKSLSPVALLSSPYLMKEEEANQLSYAILDLDDDQNEFLDFNFERTVNSADIETIDNPVHLASTQVIKPELLSSESEKPSKKENRKSIPPHKPLPLIPPPTKKPPPPPPPRTYQPKRIPNSVKPRETVSDSEQGNRRSPLPEDKTKSDDLTMSEKFERDTPSDQKKGIFAGLKSLKFPLNNLKKSKQIEDISEPTSFVRVAHYEMNPESNEIEVIGDGGEFVKSLTQAYKELIGTKDIKDIGELWKTYRLFPKVEIKSKIQLYTLIENYDNSPPKILVDYWSSQTMKYESFVVGEPSLISPEHYKDSLVDLDILNSGYSIELDTNSTTNDLNPEKCKIIDIEEDFDFFHAFFKQDECDHYSSVENGVILSVEATKPHMFVRKIIVRNRKEDKRILINPSMRIKDLQKEIPEISMKLKSLNSDKLYNDLVAWENMNIISHYKFGIVYIKPNQIEENDFYSNNVVSKAYEDFLEFIGTKIQLKDWDKYRAGLDISNNNTGTHSIYTTYQGYEIMFQVATLLPFQPNDIQRVERKRHIGNDVVVIIFKEREDSSDTVNPMIFRSQFNHVFFVISPIFNEIGETSHYRLTVAYKPSVKPAPPRIPESPIFEKNEIFREFLLSKLINSERMALKMSTFSGSRVSTRKQHMNVLIKKYT